ncbi:unnamed protein product, partial [Arabidopsis halleri]
MAERRQISAIFKTNWDTRGCGSTIMMEIRILQRLVNSIENRFFKVDFQAIIN